MSLEPLSSVEQPEAIDTMSYRFPKPSAGQDNAIRAYSMSWPAGLRSMAITVGIRSTVGPICDGQGAIRPSIAPQEPRAEDPSCRRPALKSARTVPSDALRVGYRALIREPRPFGIAARQPRPTALTNRRCVGV